ncbi:MAG TPA: hypothetical protein VMW54_14405, partial [Terriglobia bacterium]|nr:hypothetical protein [Terriglobia bacterium]
MVLPCQRNRTLEKELTPHGESNTDHRAVSTSCAGFEGEFPGRPVREDAAGAGPVLVTESYERVKADAQAIYRAEG